MHLSECLQTNRTTEFQFHKVRLKALHDGLPDHPPTFQFHKVRLKVSDPPDIIIIYEFQFHKVRLKVNMEPPPLPPAVVSIP